MHEKRPRADAFRSTPPGTITVNGRNVRYDGAQNPKAIATWLRERRFRSTADIRDRMRGDLAERERELGRVIGRTPSQTTHSPRPGGWTLDVQ